MRREKHVKSFLKRLAAGAAATLMAVTTIIVNVEPMKARDNDGYYTVIDQYNEFYGSVFGDLDPDMPGWWSTHFTVEDSDGETYSAMCAQPHVKTAENGQVVIDGDTYSSDEADDDRATYARILYWSIGHGPMYGYSYELRWIIAHHTFALAKGDENWNTSPAVRREWKWLYFSLHRLLQEMQTILLFSHESSNHLPLLLRQSFYSGG
mgnify:CR=1 FL=1